MRYNEITETTGSTNDYQQMLNFVRGNAVPGVPPDQQVAVALFKELQKQQQQNQQLGSELSAAEKRIDTATQSGELSKAELGKHQGELERERGDIEQQRDKMSQIDQQHSAREKASTEQIKSLTSQLETIKNRPGVSPKAAKELEAQIQELKKNGGDPQKFQALEQQISRMQKMQHVDDGTMQDLVKQVKDAQAKAEELGKTKASLSQDIDQATQSAQAEIEQIKQQLAHFKEVERTVSALTPIAMDIKDVMDKVGELDSENEHIYQELGQHDDLLRKLSPGALGNDDEGGMPAPAPKPAPQPAPQFNPNPIPTDYDALDQDEASRAKALAAMAKAQLSKKPQPEPVDESQFFKAIKWATGK